MAKVRKLEVSNSKQTAIIMVPSGNQLIEKVFADAYLLEVVDRKKEIQTAE